MPKLRSTYDGRLIYKTSYTKGARLFLGTIRLQKRKIVSDSVRKLAYDIPERKLSTLLITIVSRSYDKLKTFLLQTVRRYFVNWARELQRCGNYSIKACSQHTKLDTDTTELLKWS